MTDFTDKLDEMLQGFYHRANTHGMNDEFDDDTKLIRRLIAQLIKKEVIGKNDHYSNFCEDCDDWDEGRNDLRAIQRKTLRGGE